MRIRNRYDADVPVVVGPVARRRPVFVEAARFLRSATDRKVKFTLPGPMTMVDTLYDAHYRSREKLAWAFAEILNDEARAIEAAGVDVIQFDEPAFNVYFDEVRDWGVRTLERAAQGLRCTTAVHICYGYGIKANIEWKKTLGAEWRQYEQTFPLLAQSAIRQVSLECANSHVPIDLHRTPRREGRPGRGDRRRDRAHRDAGGRRRDDSLRAPIRSRPTASTRARTAGWCRSAGTSPGASFARWARAPRWSGPRSRSPIRRRSPSGRALPASGDPARRRFPRPSNTTSAGGVSCVSCPTCFSFKAVSTPCTTALQSFHRRSFLEIETWPGSIPISILFVRNY